MKIRIKYPLLIASDTLIKYSEYDQPHMDEDRFNLYDKQGHKNLFNDIVKDNLRHFTNNGRVELL